MTECWIGNVLIIPDMDIMTYGNRQAATGKVVQTTNARGDRYLS